MMTNPTSRMVALISGEFHNTEVDPQQEQDGKTGVKSDIRVFFIEGILNSRKSAK
jgi:hypothetical protein